MTVGMITTQKNPYFIVDIIRELANSKVDFRFWWFGDDELNGDVQRYAENRASANIFRSRDRLET